MSDRKSFFNRLHTFFLSPGDLILGGDFNCIDSDLDRLHIKSDFSADKRCLSALKSSGRAPRFARERSGSRRARSPLVSFFAASVNAWKRVFFNL